MNRVFNFMKSTRSFGRIAGIPLNVQMNWFPSILLVTWSIAGGYFPNQYPQWETQAYWSVGLLTAALFFLSVLLHELGHSIVAVREGIRVDGITLFLLGGMAQIAREPATPGSEARVVGAGPLTSLFLAGVFYVASIAFDAFPHLAAAALYLTYVNLILAIFNLIPGFPLDGGRLLRALLWKLVRHHARATRWAIIIGLIFAISLVLIGAGAFLLGQFFTGFWLMVIGLYLGFSSKDGLQKVRSYREKQTFKPRVEGYTTLQSQPVAVIEDSNQP
jgi:Zn-dependent protease